MTEANHDNPSFNIELSLDVINQLLAQLGEQPYKHTAGIISLIMRQVQPQIEALQAQRAAESAPDGGQPTE